MDMQDRAQLFTRFVGLELKGRITARGFTAKAVATEARHSPAAFNRWLNGRVEIPLAVLHEACEIVGVHPGVIIDAAYDRVLLEMDSTDDAPGGARPVSAPRNNAPQGLAAKRGRRKGDIDAAE